MRTRGRTAAAVVAAAWAVAAAAGTARGQESGVLEELRALRERVQELEEWKRAHAGDGEGGQAGDLRAAVAEILAESRGEASLPPSRVEAPRSQRIEFGGQVRLRYELQRRSHLPADPDGRDTFDAVLSRVRLHADARIAEDLRAYVELQDARIWGTEPSTASNTGNVDLSQGHVDFEDLLGSGTTLRAGRQALALSDERFVGALEWSNTGRRFDGVTAWRRTEDLEVTAFAHRVVEGFVEPGGPVPAGGDTDTDFLGLFTALPRLVPASRLELFGLWLRSGTPLPSQPDPAPGRGDTSFGTFGFRLHGAHPGSGLDWDVQSALQRGELRGDPLSAWAARGAVGYRLSDTGLRPRIFAEVDFATGEERTDDGDRDQFQVLFPTNHGWYGIHDYAAWSNLSAWSVGVSAEPGTDWDVTLAFWDFRLEEPAGGWVVASGATLRPGVRGASRDLGQELDLVVTWKGSPGTVVQAGWAHFFPGAFVRSTQGPEGGATDTDFVYLMVTVSF